MSKKVLPYVFASVIGFSFPINSTFASGIPVVDGANLAQNLMNYAQYLLDYQQMLKDFDQQISMLRQQEVDSTKGAAAFYSDAAKLFENIKQVASGIESIRAQYSDAANYISQNYGDSSFWQKCVQTNCNPFDQLNKARQTNIQELMYSLGSIEAISKRVNQSSSNVTSIMGALDGSNKGINQTLGKMAELLAELQQTQAATYQMIASAMAAQNAVALEDQQRKKLDQEKREKFFKSAEVSNTKYSFSPSAF